MRTQTVGSVADLPTTGFDSAALTWWGTLAFMSLEGSGFVLAGGAYLYLMAVNPEWPFHSPLPNYWPGTIVALLLLASLPLNRLTAKWARARDLVKVQFGLVGMSLFGIAPLVVRWYEFPALNIRWDANAYGSAVWFLLGLHATHLLTDVGDTLVLTALMFTRHANNGRRFGDVTDNAFYWYFVVLTWLPIYALIYWVPRIA